jgi:putative DNA primase/helicase
MDRLVSPALGCPKGKIHLQGASTEAGIRQRIKSSSVPIIFDEFETTGEHSKARIQSCLELLRVAWSSKSGAVVKGSAGGHSVEYQVAFSALVSSIRVNLENDADRSRFSVLELEPHGNDCDRWETIQKGLLEIDEAWGERLFARSVGMVKTMIASQTVFNRVLAGVMNQRYGQQVGTLLAGYWSLLSDDVVSEATARAIVSELGQSEDEKDEIEMTDEQECLNHLLTYQLRVRRGDGSHEYKTISDIIETNCEWQRDYARSIRSYGLVLRDKTDGKHELLIAYRDAELQKIFSGTRWAVWSITLMRLPGATKTLFRSGTRHVRAVCVRL